ncbi:hypothetical protein [Rhizobium sp. CC-YZS058]|uniref:hypothetical protein n=1 Tax=Rhizobium sp. CC-YZS058 TaxID=3042153 RepID=UPI002B053F20|nr:hypothetical protein [Rhizobium sp. CC-YZS058]MEA3535447.1 hypothetical protein [Rhizobium sp. CC-YZS058]
MNNTNSLSKIAVVLLITFGLVALRWRPVEANIHSTEEIHSTVKPFLDKNGFTITQQTQDQVTASSGSCDVIIKEVAPEGWNESQMMVMAAGRNLLFVTRGQVYPGQQPVWRTWSYLQYYRVMTKIGMPVSKAFVFGVSPSTGCNAVNIDWAQLTPA